MAQNDVLFFIKFYYPNNKKYAITIVLLCKQHKICKDNYTQHNAVPAENLEVLFLDVGHKETDNDEGNDKCCCTAHKENDKLGRSKCKAEVQYFDKGEAEHYGNCKEEGELGCGNTANTD